jgi:hypothetical protein
MVLVMVVETPSFVEVLVTCLDPGAGRKSSVDGLGRSRLQSGSRRSPPFSP